MKKNLTLLAVIAVVTAFVSSLHAQPYARGSFNGWGLGQMTDDMDGTFSWTTNGLTAGSAQEYKIDTTGDWSSAFPPNNAKTVADGSGNITVHWAPGVINDGWEPISGNRVGFDDPGQFGWEIIGAFNGWDVTQPTNAQMTDVGGGLYSVDYTITNAPGSFAFKFRQSGSWDYQYGTEGFAGGGDLSVTTTQANQVVTFQLELPGGRYLAGPTNFPPTNMITFSCDMEVPLSIVNPGDPDFFNPLFQDLVVRGSWNGFTTDTNTYQLFRDGTTSLFTNTVPVLGNLGTAVEFKFFKTDGADGGVEETPLLLCNANRTLTITNSTQTADSEFWSDRQLSDPTNLVSFAVDMSVQKALGFFDDFGGKVHARGSFNGWLDGGYDFTTDTQWELAQVGATLVYSNTFEIVEPAGASNCVKSYKFFGVDFAGAENPGYESIANREFILTNGVTTVLPQVFFNNESSECPFVTGATNYVEFSVDMTGAVGWTGSPVWSNQNVYINGNFVGWVSQANGTDNWGLDPKPELMLTKNPTSNVHTIEVPFAPGSRVQAIYKFSIGGEDNEADFDLNHVRYVRTTPGQTNYAMPQDVWTGSNPTNIANLVEDELSLSATAGAPGTVDINYWGVQCAELQSAPIVTGPWTTVSDAVDVGSTNVSSTLDQEYFRLVKP